MFVKETFVQYAFLDIFLKMYLFDTFVKDTNIGV